MEAKDMTEKEKMLRHWLYDANYDEALAKERDAAKALCHRFNLLSPSDKQGQQDILRQLLGKTGEHFTVTPRRSGATMATTLSSARIFIPTTISSFSTLLKSGLGITCLSRRTAAFIRRGTPSTLSAATRGSNTPTPSPSATMCGLAAACR